MRFVCDSCHARYMIRDEKVGPKGIAARCKRCGHTIVVKRLAPSGEPPAITAIQPAPLAEELGSALDRALATATQARLPEREPTRVMDLDDMARLLRPRLPSPPKPEEYSGFGAAGAEWFVAVADAPVGPLDIDQIRERWKRGELSTNSLCWKADMRDWGPLSSIPTLAGELMPDSAPHPEPAGAVATGIQAPATPQSAEGDATGALAALVDDELRALDREAISKVEDTEPEPQPLIEVEPPPALPIPFPDQPESVPPTPPISAQPHQRPIAQSSTALYLAIGVPLSLFAIGATVISVVYLMKSPAPILLPTPIMAPGPVAANAPPVETTQAKASPTAPAEAAIEARAEKPAPKAEEKPLPPPVTPAIVRPPSGQSRVKIATAALATTAPKQESGDATDAAFNALFEEAGAKGSTAAAVELAEPVRSGKPSLDQSEILEVLAAHRSELRTCTDRARREGSAGTVVMRWLIRSDGTTANIQTQTEEFQKTALSACLATAVGHLRFPSYSGPPMQPVEVPLKF